MKRTWVIIGIIFLFVCASITPGIQGSTEERTNTKLHASSSLPANVTITDWTRDVSSLNIFLNKRTIITNSTDIEVDNLDLIQTTFSQQGIEATLSLQVVGSIENRGQFSDENETIELVEYSFFLDTSEKFYMITYMNQTGVLFYDDVLVNLTSSDFTVLNNSLSITFSLVNLTETYVNLSSSAVFIRTNLSSNPPLIILLADTIPNQWQKAILVGRYNSIDIDSRGAYMTLEADRLWMIRFHPFKLIRYTPGDIIRISTPYMARIITNHFIVGKVDVLWI